MFIKISWSINSREKKSRRVGRYLDEYMNTILISGENLYNEPTILIP